MVTARGKRDAISPIHGVEYPPQRWTQKVMTPVLEWARVLPVGVWWMSPCLTVALIANPRSRRSRVSRSSFAHISFKRHV
jgi:hypothetical protein